MSITIPPPITVQSNAMPRDGYTARAGPMGASGDSPTATAAATSDPATTAPMTPMRPSAVVIAGLAPMRAERVEVVGVEPQLATDHLGSDQERRDRGDDAEHAERDGLRLDRAFGLGLEHRGDVHVVAGVLRHRPLDLALNLRDRARTAVELETAEQVGVATFGDRTRERGREDQVAACFAVRVDVVLDDVVVEFDDAHHSYGHSASRLDLRGAERGKLRLARR